jgi:glycosyltransferase involved in cell wall biosynthesis
MHRQKEPGLFVRVAARLRASHPEMRFVWIGAADPSVLEAARGYGLGEGFLAIGHTDRVPELLPALDVFLLTSRWEGLPLVLVEAQAAGVPVVASAVNGVVDVVRDGETGLLFPSGDEGAAAAAVERLLNDPGLREKLTSRATAEIERFDIKRMVQGYEEVYEDVLRRA